MTSISIMKALAAQYAERPAMEAVLEIPKKTTISNTGFLEFTKQLANLGVALHENRKTDRTNNYRIRLTLKSLLKPYNVELKSKRGSDLLGEAFTFYIVRGKCDGTMILTKLPSVGIKNEK